MTLTRVPDVVDALLTILEDASGLQVLDGPHLGEVMDEAIVVGLTEGDDAPGYSVSVDRLPGLGAPRYLESWTVRSLLTLTSGDTGMGALRTRAAEILADLDAALRSAHVEDGVWQRASLADGMEWVPVQHEGGVTLSVFFRVAGASLL